MTADGTHCETWTTLDAAEAGVPILRDWHLTRQGKQAP